MEAAVDAVAARLRAGEADALAGWGACHGSASGDAIPRRTTRVFASLPSRRRPPFMSHSDDTVESVDWHALLRTLCRRFAGSLVVEGKLLNHEEIQVQRMARTDGTQRGTVALPSQLRFLVRCRDAPTARIGLVVAARVAKHHARVISDATSLSSPVVAYRTELLAADASSDLDVTTMTSVFGFDVSQFVGGPVRQRRRPSDRGRDFEDDDDEWCANAAIVKHTTFSDLRGVRRLMEASDVSPAKWTALLTAPRVPTHETDSVMLENDPWSHVALATAQKRLWARERVTRGDALRAKGRLKECLAEYDSALRLDDAYGEALLRRGQVYTELRRYEDAIRDFERLTRLEPANEIALQGLLRAKGKLGHSKHVVAASFHPRRSRSSSRDRRRRESPPPRSSSEPNGAHDDTNKEDDMLTTLEKDRLRQLLEEEVARTRKRSRKGSSHRRSERTNSSSSETDDDSSSSGSETSHRRKRSRSSRHKKSKKSKRSSSSRDRKKQKKHKKHKKKNRYSRDSDSDSDRRSSDTSIRRSRSRSRTRSNRSASVVAHEPHKEQSEELHPILARKPHRLWN